MAAKRPYHKEMARILDDIQLSGKRPHLFLHCCCGPCATHVLDLLSPYFIITAYYDNSNIHPREEYVKRLAELNRVVQHVAARQPVHLDIGTYTPDDYFQAVTGLEHLGEGSARCTACIRQRLAVTALKAVETGADYFASTLSISPHKDATLINAIGEQLAATHQLRHLPNDFKKGGGFQHAAVLCKNWHIKRQTYCGCSFSLDERLTASHNHRERGI